MSTDLAVIEAALKAATEGRAVMNATPIQRSIAGAES